MIDHQAYEAAERQREQEARARVWAERERARVEASNDRLARLNLSFRTLSTTSPTPASTGCAS